MDGTFGWVIAVWSAVNWNAVGSVTAARALLLAVANAWQVHGDRQSASAAQLLGLQIICNELADAARYVLFADYLRAEARSAQEVESRVARLRDADHLNLPSPAIPDAVLAATAFGEELSNILSGRSDHPAAVRRFRLEDIEASLDGVILTLERQIRRMGARGLASPGWDRRRIQELDYNAETLRRFEHYQAPDLETEISVVRAAAAGAAGKTATIPMRVRTKAGLADTYEVLVPLLETIWAEGRQTEAVRRAALEAAEQIKVITTRLDPIRARSTAVRLET